jgi:hypothetical protein
VRGLLYRENPEKAKHILELSCALRDATRPNHFVIRAWSFAVFAMKSSLQTFRQKRGPFVVFFGLDAKLGAKASRQYASQ